MLATARNLVAGLACSGLIGTIILKFFNTLTLLNFIFVALTLKYLLLMKIFLLSILEQVSYNNLYDILNINYTNLFFFILKIFLVILALPYLINKI